MAFAVPGYRVGRPLGAGSSGEVWSAVEEATGQRVALKRIATPTEAARVAAEREAALLTGLVHPHLVRMLAFISVAGAAVLVLELAEAGSLAGLLRRRSQLTPAEVVAVVSPVAAGLAYLHEAGVVHGDISPANLVFTAAGYPQLADLGLARMLPNDDLRIGTPAYLDPAVAAGAPFSRASDVFSLAAVALHALTGSGPWHRPGNRGAPANEVAADRMSAEQVLAVAAAGIVVDLEDRLRSIPPALGAPLRRALDPAPDRRGTAGELALDLRASLPPRPVVLAGGRIVERVGRHSADRYFGTAPASDVRFHDPAASGPNFVPADLTSLSARLGPLVNATEVAALVAGVPTPPRAVPARLVTTGLRGIRRSSRIEPVRKVRLSWRVVLPAALGVLLLAAIGLTGRFRSAGSADRKTWASSAAAAIPAQRAPAQHTQAPATASRTFTAGRLPDVNGQPSSLETEVVNAERALSGLSLVREQAFAQRRPELLRQVYRASDLLRADSAVLLSTVRPGCGLFGLRPAYRGLRVAEEPAGRLRIDAVASLPSATLRCGGRPSGQTAAGRPITLSLVLARFGPDYRIESQTAR